MTPDEYKAMYAVERKSEATSRKKRERFKTEYPRRRGADLKVWVPLRTCGGPMDEDFVFRNLEALWDKRLRCYLIRSEDDLPVIRSRLSKKGFDLIDAPNGGWTSKDRKR